MEEVPLQIDVGHQVDRYRVVRVLGQGGMATVYLVEHLQLGSQHALKVLDAASSALKERLLREGQVQAKLNHPNVVQVTDVLDLGGVPGLLMEHVDGGDLGQWLESNQPSTQDVMALFLGVLAGVEAAHQQGVVHRDLKPANVLLQRTESGWIPKVTDFGLAKRVQDADANALTRTGAQMGTPAYMAPEQVRNSKAVDARADVFALGCILYEMLCGERAFKGQDTFEVFRGIVEERYRSPADIPRDVEPVHLNAIEGCLAAPLEQRIQDCQTLREILAGERVWVRPALTDPTATFAIDEGWESESVERPSEVLLPDSMDSLAGSDGRRPPKIALWGAVVLLVVGVLAWTLWPSDSDSPVKKPVPAQLEETPEPSAAPLEKQQDEPVEVQEESPRETSDVKTSKPVSRKPKAPQAIGFRSVGDGQVTLTKAGMAPVGAGEALLPGTYAIRVRFSDGTLRHGGRLSVKKGDTPVIRCDEATLLCTREQ